MAGPWRKRPFLAALLLLAARPVPAGEPPLLFPPPAEVDSSLSWVGSEDYTIDDLWEKINGEAEFYRLFGLVEASFARYEIPGETDSSLEIGLYRLPGSLAAFGLFSSFRSPGSPDLTAGNGAAVDEYQGFLWHGSRFVVADAFGSPGFRARVLPKALRAMAARMGAPPPRPPLLLFMEDLADRGTVRFRPDHLLGSEFLPPGLEGARGEATLLLATGEPAGEEVLDRFGPSLEGPRRETWDGASVLLGTDRYHGPVILSVRGARLAGVLSPSPAASLRPIILRLLEAPSSPP